MKSYLLEVNDLQVSFNTEEGPLQVVRGFDMTLESGEIIGVIGESGSGKTVSAMSLCKLYEAKELTYDYGNIIFEGQQILYCNERVMREIRGKEIAYVFQNPKGALNPNKRIGKQLSDVLRNHGIPVSWKDIYALLEEVGVEEPRTVCNMYPDQLSGGLNQRVMIAQAIITRPKLLIADEPTSAIDASVRKKILDLLKDINRKYGISVMIITHDFDVAKYVCDRILVMYGGLVVESGSKTALLEAPLHPYTEALIKCARSLEEADGELFALEGRPPSPKEFEDSCPFINRCPFKEDVCRLGIPEIVHIGKRSARCIESLLYKRG